MKLPIIDPIKKQQAFKILTAIDWFIEQNREPALDLIGMELPQEEWELDSYWIEVQKTPVGILTRVLDREGILEIEMLGNVLLKAEGISDRDCKYWAQIYLCNDNISTIRENPL